MPFWADQRVVRRSTCSPTPSGTGIRRFRFFLHLVVFEIPLQTGLRARNTAWVSSWLSLQMRVVDSSTLFWFSGKNPRPSRESLGHLPITCRAYTPFWVRYKLTNLVQSRRTVLRKERNEHAAFPRGESELRLELHNSKTITPTMMRVLLIAS